MIVPRSKLLFWFAAIALPFGLLAALAPEAGVVSLAAVGVLAIVAIADAVGAGKSLAAKAVAEVVRRGDPARHDQRPPRPWPTDDPLMARAGAQWWETMASRTVACGQEWHA